MNSSRSPLSPAPLAPPDGRGWKAASVVRRVRAQAAFEAGTLLRNGEQLLVTLLLPALALVGLAAADFPVLGPGPRIDIITPGVLALAIVSTAFTGQAIATGFDRRYGVLRLFGASPLGRAGLLAGKAGAVLLVEALQFVLLSGLGVALGWRPVPAGLVYMLVFWVLGTWAFVALALLLAGLLRAEAVLALANFIWVLLAGLGGLLLPRQLLPEPLSSIVSVLPSSALGDGMRAALHLGTLDAGYALLLLVWALLATAGCLRTFRWSD